jgi:hypothetical protein
MPAPAGTTNYVLTVAGQVVVDNDVLAIVRYGLIGKSPTCKPVSEGTAVGYDGWTIWQPFSFSAQVEPGTNNYLYFVVYNDSTVANPTGLRVEFTSAYFTPQ